MGVPQPSFIIPGEPAITDEYPKITTPVALEMVGQTRYGRDRRLFWDAPDSPEPREKHNVYHMLDRHKVSRDEVEQVLEGSPVVLDVQHLQGRNPVYGVVGYTARGGLLEVWGVVFRDPPSCRHLANNYRNGRR